MFPSFINQVGMIKNKTVESFKARLTEIESRPLENILITLKQTLNDLVTQHIASFQNHTLHSTALLFEG